MHILKTALTIVAVTLMSVLLLLLIINAVFHIIYADFYKRAERDFKIPGLNSGFIPQGVEETPEGIIISGYMKDKSASRIYITDGKKSRFVELFNADGTPHTGHGGGIDFDGDRVFLTGDGEINILSLLDIADGDGRATVTGTFDPRVSPAWCCVKDGYIFAGSFASKTIKPYPPKAEEIITTPAGEENIALVLAFKLDNTAPLGISTEPEFAISIGEKVQGFSFVDDGTIVLSTSYGLSSSELIFHSLEKMKSAHGTYENEGVEIPLYYLDKASETRRVKAPPMAEELMIKDGYIYIMNESACNKYIFGKLLDQYRIWRYKI